MNWYDPNICLAVPYLPLIAEILVDGKTVETECRVNRIDIFPDSTYPQYCLRNSIIYMQVPIDEDTGLYAKADFCWGDIIRWRIMNEMV